MDRTVTVVLVAALAVVIGVIIQGIIHRSRGGSRESPRVQGAYRVPTSIQRADFAEPDKAWLVAVFSSETCAGCIDTFEAARQLRSEEVSVEEVEVVRHKALHDKYGIDAVPTTLVCDATGAVRRWFLGPTSAAGLWGAVAELRSDED